MIKLISIAVGAIFALCILWGTFYTVDQGERGVILTNGAITNDAGPGLHFKIPMIQSVEMISVQTQKDAFEKQDDTHDYRMQAYTQDQQPAIIALSVNYHVTDPNEVYSQFGSIANMESKVIDPRSSEQLKNVFGRFSAAQAIQERAKLNQEVTDAIRKSMVGPVVVDSVQIEDISFSDSFEKAVENRMAATVRQQQAEAEKARRITEADAAAYEVTAAANAQAHKTEVEGQATADAIQKRGEALKGNPDLVALTAAEAWDGHLPATMVPGGAVPFVHVGAQ